jgi:FtsP/CotA-like multicopper oxidase with cupredoxin domain
MKQHEISMKFSQSRRHLLAAGGLTTLALAMGKNISAAQEPAPVRRLTARPGNVQLVPAAYPQTEIWGYDGSVPGPELRLRQGERLRVEVENLLTEETTVHWHGIRLPNAMDGVPHLTQKPIAANGGKFVYDKPTRHREWLDTVLVAPRETTEIAFVADNPGDWMFHCHILEHQASGMMSTIRVA